MNAYLPSDLPTLWLAMGLLAGTVVLSLLLSRLPANALTRILTWTLVIGAFAATERITAGQPAGFRMLAIIGALLLALKGVVSVEWLAERGGRLRPGQWLAFACGWLGMRPAAFAGFPGPAKAGALALMVRGASWLFGGALCVAAARFCLALPMTTADATARRFLAGALMLVGISLVLHFGLINIVSGAWRLAGADTQALFRAPAYSRNLTEFWGRRWNLAFTELATLAVYRPLCGVIGRRGAGVAAFLFSGLLHELAISVPVNAGYGLPLAYFGLHAAAMQIEQFCAQRGRPADRWGAAGRFWTAAWILIPLPILFHPPFIAGVVLPLIE